MRRRADLAADIFTGLVVASVGVALAGLTWRLMGDPGVDSAVPLRSAALPPPAVDVSQIAGLSPFGATAAAAQATAGDLQLRAILFARPRASSSIMVSANGGPAQAYLVGATLPNGAILDSVELDHAVLRTATGRQTLAFPNAGPALTNASSAGGDVAAIRALIPTAAQGVAPTAGPTVAVPIAAVPPPPSATSQAVLGQMDATPTGSGYRIGTNLAPQMRMTGLLPGDVVDRINGKPVGDPQSDRELLNSAMTSGNARIELVRDGKRITLSFPLR